MTEELRKRSLRLLIDIQACQTNGSAKRGVGRYSRALFESLLAEAQQHDIFMHLANNFPAPAGFKELSESHVLRSPSLPGWNTPRDYRGGEQDTLDSLALSAYIAPLKADIIHVSHVFEGFNERVALPDLGQRAPGQIISATLYDLIPLLFQEHYFQDETFRKWYTARLSWLRQADLLLAISEASKQDAITLLGIEPQRIVTIYGGISSHFIPLDNKDATRRKLAKKYGLREHFVLFAGGDEYRKNIHGAIRGYAAVPSKLRKNCQLVIVCSIEDHRKMMFLNEIRSYGLSPEDIVFTGFVSEEDLVAFYGACDLFIFPSLYEGLGLPVLEAMACGAPVIGGNNSSIHELIVRPDALFDASSHLSIGAGIAKALSSKDYTNDLREYGLQRSKDFTWQRTAKLALESFDEAAKRSRESGVQSAIKGWLPRKRLAIFTPLPPCRSGIASYNAQFLPYLARHFEIDLYVDNYKVADEILTSSFRIFSAQDFEAVASKYDAILYEFGNSEFHTHMLPLLEKHPGIVGLHDAYLSGLFSYLDFNMGMVGSYAIEMLTAHGTAARHYFAPVQNNPNAVGDTMVKLPCTKRVLDNALGVISHSPFNLEIARSHYPEGWQAPYRIIPQMVSVPQTWSEEQRIAARKHFGFQPGDFIISAFGHVVWTKWGDRLVKAFLRSALHDDGQVHLVFAGELAKDDFGRNLKKAIQKSGFKDRIHITGFLTGQDFERYLHITDLAVQLRTKSRGGTPKGVLDCLANGVPVLVNNYASYTDYPDDVVMKLSAEPSIEEITHNLEEIYANSSQRKAYVNAGLSYVRDHHSPVVCAAAYAGAIHEFMERHSQTKDESYVPALAPHLAGCTKPDDAVKLANEWFNNIPSPVFKKSRLIIDVSHIAQKDHKTGIQRVVKEIVRALYCSEKIEVEPVAVELVNGSIKIAEDWLQSQNLLVPTESEILKDNILIEFRPGDVLLMLDSSWERYREFFPVFEQARLKYVPIYTAIYDILPLVLPPGNFVEGGREWFENWFQAAASVSDGLVCISQTVADDVVNYLDSLKDLPYRPKIGYWHLGSNFENIAERDNLSQSTFALASHSYLLMIGTIEPRKNHALALEAMEKLWEEGHDLELCIVGKEGWMADELMERLRNHPLAEKKLFLFEGPNDADLLSLYTNASGLLFLSKGEGFGLPLVEASHHGIPIICSDIPVFHEICGDFATYVNNGNSDKLVKDLKDWWNRKQGEQLPDTKLMSRLSWEQSSIMLLQVLINNNWME